MAKEVNYLGLISDSIRDVAALRRREEDQWRAGLGDPVIFVQDDDSELAAKGFGLGFFKSKDGGVVAIQRYANGYSKYQQTHYSAFMIGLLDKVLRS